MSIEAVKALSNELSAGKVKRVNMIYLKRCDERDEDSVTDEIDDDLHFEVEIPIDAMDSIENSSKPEVYAIDELDIATEITIETSNSTQNSLELDAEEPLQQTSYDNDALKTTSSKDAPSAPSFIEPLQQLQRLQHKSTTLSTKKWCNTNVKPGSRIESILWTRGNSRIRCEEASSIEATGGFIYDSFENTPLQQSRSSIRILYW